MSTMSTALKSRQAGFTVIELIVAAIVLGIAGVFVFIQINNLKITNQDSERKASINAFYYGLEEVYYKQHQSYPATLTSAALPSVDPALFTDPDGFTLGEQQDTSDTDKAAKQVLALSSGKKPNYHYDATNCDTDRNCKSYTLRADLVSEAQYVKKSRNN